MSLGKERMPQQVNLSCDRIAIGQFFPKKQQLFDSYLMNLSKSSFLIF
jgi:hypothetical protein